MTNRFISFKTRTCRTGGGGCPLHLSMLFTVLYGLCLLAASCGDPAYDTILPPRKYPITFTASVQGLAATATVTRGATSEGRWSVGDLVAVQMRGVAKRYVVTAVDDRSNATLSGVDADNTFYWEDIGKKESVSAWYRNANREPEKIDFSSVYLRILPRQDLTPAGYKEDNYQLSDFLYATSADLSFGDKKSAKLSFYHQLARVTIDIKEVEGGDASEITRVFLGDPDRTEEIVTAKIYTPPTPGEGRTQGAWGMAFYDLDLVVPKKLVRPNVISGDRVGVASYEALLIPGAQLYNPKSRFINVELKDGKIYSYTPLRLTDTYLMGGKKHTYEITVKKNTGLKVVAVSGTAWEAE